jgi:predicted transcriptional regulator
MTTLELHLPDELASKAQRLAKENGVPLDELLVQCLEEKLARDEQFASAARIVLAKNAELYERLS